MDYKSIKKVVGTNQPFRITTAAGEVYKVKHRDFFAFSAKRTSVIIAIQNKSREDFVFVPLAAITVIEAEGAKTAD